MKKYETKNMNLQLFAGEITDLTGTTWELYSDISIDGNIFNINFISNSTNFKQFFLDLGMEINFAKLSYLNSNTDDYVDVFRYRSGLWTDQAYRTINITGGTDSTNSDLIS